MVHLLLTLGVLIISFSAVFVRLAGVAPDTSAFFRTLYALPLLFGFWWLDRKRDHRSVRERGMAVAAGSLLGLDLAFWHRAIDQIGAGLSTVLGNTQVMFVGLAAWWLYRERPSRSALLSVPVILLGVAFISGLGRGDTYGANPTLGALFGLATGVTYALFILLLRSANRSPSPPVAAMLDATVGACLTCLVVGLVSGQLDPAFDWEHHRWLIALAIGSQVVGWTLISSMLPRLPALTGSVLLLLQPVGTILWGRLLFAEILSPLQWTGVALVIGGVGWLSARGTVSD